MLLSTLPHLRTLLWLRLLNHSDHSGPRAVATMNRNRRPASPRTIGSPLQPPSPRGMRLQRQIYIVIIAALGIFVTSTFILSTFIPSPTDPSEYNNNHEEFHSVTNVVQQQQHHHFFVPKGHLRRQQKNDIIRYKHDENNHLVYHHDDDDGGGDDDDNDDQEATDDGEEEQPQQQYYNGWNRPAPYDDYSNNNVHNNRNGWVWIPNSESSADPEVEEETEEAENDDGDDNNGIDESNYPHPREGQYQHHIRYSKLEEEEREEPYPQRGRQSHPNGDDLEEAAEDVAYNKLNSGPSSDNDEDEKNIEGRRSNGRSNDDKVNASPRQKSQRQNEPEEKNVNNALKKEGSSQVEIVEKTPTSAAPPSPRIFHILETRFMQNQPDLVALAKARLQLFKAICLPTVVQQTAWGNFLWIIRTDPDLHPDVRHELVDMLNDSGALSSSAHAEKDEREQPQPQKSLTYVIGSNDNYIVANSTTVNPQIHPFDLNDLFSSMLSKPDKIFAGNLEHLKSLSKGVSSTENDIILWTRLDADDGLSVEFMKYIQDQTKQYFMPKTVNDGSDNKKEKEEEDKEEGEESFANFVPVEEDKDEKEEQEEDEDEKEDQEEDEEEGNSKDGKIEESSSDAEKENVLDSTPYSPPNWMYWCGGQNMDWFLTDPIHDPAHDTGVLYPVIHENVCVTPGITISMRADMNPSLVPRLDHDKIISYLSDLGGDACNRTGTRDDDKVSDDGDCFQMLQGWTHAVRSRTPTSAGMMGVNPDENQINMVRRGKGTLKKLLWSQMHKDFLIKDSDLRQTNSYFAKHVYDIAEENARGQCTNGHSCKTSSKDRLQMYSDLKVETSDGGFDVVSGFIVRPAST